MGLIYWRSFIFAVLVNFCAQSQLHANDGPAESLPGESVVQDQSSCAENISLLDRIRSFKNALKLRVMSASLPDVIASAEHLPPNQVMIYPLRLGPIGPDRNIMLANGKAYLIVPHSNPGKRKAEYSFYQYVELDVIDSQIVMKGRSNFHLGNILPFIRSPLGRYKGWRFGLTENSEKWVRESLKAESGEFQLGGKLIKTLELKSLGRAPKFHSFRALAARVAALALLLSPVPFGQPSMITGRLIPPALVLVHQWIASDFAVADSNWKIWQAVRLRAEIDGEPTPPEDYGLTGYGKLSHSQIFRYWMQVRSILSARENEAKKADWFKRLADAIRVAVSKSEDQVSRSFLDEIVPRLSNSPPVSKSDPSIPSILELAEELDVNSTFMPALMAAIPANISSQAGNAGGSAPYFDPKFEKFISDAPFSKDVTDAAMTFFKSTRKGDYSADENISRQALLQEILKQKDLGINEILTAMKYLGRFEIDETQSQVVVEFQNRMLLPVIKEFYSGDSEKVEKVIYKQSLMEWAMMHSKGGLKSLQRLLKDQLSPDQALKLISDLSYYGDTTRSNYSHSNYSDGRYDWVEKDLREFQSDQELFDNIIDDFFRSILIKNTSNDFYSSMGLDELLGFTNDPKEFERRVDRLISHFSEIKELHPYQLLEYYRRVANGFNSIIFSKDPNGLDFARLMKEKLVKAVDARQNELKEEREMKKK